MGLTALASIRAALALALAIAVAPAAQAQAPVEHIEITSRLIENFQIGLEQKNFGPLEFVGGLEMTSASTDFGALSAFRFTTPGKDFVGVADTGFWFFGSIARDAAGKPVGVENFRMVPMVDAKGIRVDEKQLVDAEGLDVKDGIATVGFERSHRIAQYKLDPDDMKGPVKALDFLVPDTSCARIVASRL
jgi:hypothetical protein